MKSSHHSNTTTEFKCTRDPLSFTALSVTGRKRVKCSRGRLFHIVACTLLKEDSRMNTERIPQQLEVLIVTTERHGVVRMRQC